MNDNQSTFNSEEWLNPQGFIGIRNGIREHIDSGCFSATDLGVYFYLQAHVNWATGICYTNAVTMALKLDETPVRSVQRSFAKLRERGYINYPEKYHGGSYPVLINKFRPTNGLLLGAELDAFKSKDFEQVIYTYWGCSSAKFGWTSPKTR